MKFYQRYHSVVFCGFCQKNKRRSKKISELEQEITLLISSFLKLFTYYKYGIMECIKVLTKTYPGSSFNNTHIKRTSGKQNGFCTPCSRAY